MIKLSHRDILTAAYTIQVRINNNILMCEYARTEYDRQHGLMFRMSMPNNHGMLFDTFDRYRPLFHMKNVYMPLESIFISPQNKIVDIIPMQPLDASTIYTTRKNIPIKWVLEVHKGYCSSHAIKENDLVFLN